MARPSLRNKSPYVGDVQVEEDEGKERTAIAHMPSLDMGGKCVPGARILLKPARDMMVIYCGGFLFIVL